MGLIVGVDPGTTLGYAILDLDGDIIKVESSKQLSLSSLISEVIKHGRVLVVGTDKKKIPKFADNFAVQFGAKIISPDEDLSVDEKVKLVSYFDFENKHQRDALASARFAYKKVRKLFKKVDSYLKNKGKENIKDEVKELVLKKDLSISEAVDFLEEKEIKKKVKKKRKKSDVGVKEKKDEVKVLRELNERLLKKISLLENKLEDSKKEQDKIVDDKLRRSSKIKEEKISFLRKELEEFEKEISFLKNEIDKLRKYLLLSKKYLVVKRYKNLSKEIKAREIIFVDNADEFSEKFVDKVKDKLRVVIYKKASKKVKDRFNFIFIDSKNLKIKEEEDFVLINKKKFEESLNKIDLLKKVVEDYRKEREIR